MKKKEHTKSSLERSGKTGIARAIHTYISVVRMLHRDLGTLRIIAAYIFFAFALLSLVFTIRMPVTSDFTSPTGWATTQSRVITGFMTIVNLIVYGVILNWTRRNSIRMLIRIALIGMAFYLDTFLIQVIYIPGRDKSLF